MTNTQTEAAPAPADNMPTDPVYLARFQAIRAAGGASHVARQLGFSKGEAVRLWYVSRDPSPEHARQLVAMCGNIVNLQQILPAAFAGLTAVELGYEPA